MLDSLLQEVCIIKSSYPNHWLTLSSGLKKACLNDIQLHGWATFLFNSHRQVLNQHLFLKFGHRWHRMYNHKRTLFIVCRHKVLTKTFWSWYFRLNSANPFLFKYCIIRFFTLDPSGFYQYSNEKRNLFCPLFRIIWWSNCLNDQANTCLIHFYKRCVSLKVVILIIG